MELILINIAIILILGIGLCMILIGLPGNTIIFVTTLIYALYDHFVHIGIGELATIFVVILIGELFETFLGVLWARREKASKMALGVAVLGTILGGIIGTMILPLVGSFIGALCGGFGGSYLAEYRKTNNADQAWRVAISVIKGQILGVVIKFSIAIAVILYVIMQFSWS